MAKGYTLISLSFRLKVVKAKSPILSLENLRGIVRRAKPLKPAKSVKPTSHKVEKKRTVRQRFFNQNSVVFSFSTIGHNDRGYGLGRAAGEFPVVKRQRKCGR